MDSHITIKPGEVWRGILILSGLAAQAASAGIIANTLKSAGADQVWVWKTPTASTFPVDWPPNKKEDVADFLEEQWFVQLRVGGTPFDPEQKFPTSGQDWRLHDAWRYLETSAPPPVDPKDPTDPKDPKDPGDVDPVDPGDVLDPEDPIDPGDPYDWDVGDPTPVPKKSTPGDIGDYAGKPAGSLDVWAPRVVRAAYKIVMGVYPTPQAMQMVLAVGRTEGWYGWASKPSQWPGHHNWGAITCGGKPPVCGCGFVAGDGYYVNGKWQKYETCFAHRATNLEGAIHLVEVLVLKRDAIQDVMDSGHIIDFARAMRDTTYFCRTTRPGPDGKPCCSCATDAEKQKDAEHYAKALDYNIGKMTAINGLPRVCFLHGASTVDPFEPEDPGDIEPKDPKDPKDPKTPETPPAPYSKDGATTAVVLSILSVAAAAVLVRNRRRSRTS